MEGLKPKRLKPYAEGPQIQPKELTLDEQTQRDKAMREFSALHPLTRTDIRRQVLIRQETVYLLGDK